MKPNLPENEAITFENDRDRLLYNFVTRPWKITLFSTLGSVLIVALLTLIFDFSLGPQSLFITIITAFSISYIMARITRAHLCTIGSQNARLNRLNAELDAFAHTVAHDLKTPLNTVVGYTYLLKQDIEATKYDKAAVHAQAILRGSHKAVDIIDELLLLASSHQDNISITPLDMAQIIEQAQERQQLLIDEYEVEIVLPDSWPAAEGFAPWVEAVWSNYLSNAIKYGGSPPHIELGARQLTDNMIEFWVQDNGPGIPMNEQSNLFKEFSTTSYERGHGLGLSIVRRIVTRMGGEVSVSSQPGHGSRFSFTLPATSSTHEQQPIPSA